MRALTILLVTLLAGSARAETPSLALAREAGKWLARQAVETPRGVTWPADPSDAATIGPSLYSGSAGVVVFLFELDRATGDRAFTDLARRGADELVASLDVETDCGLYTGIAGIGWALRRAHDATGEPRYRDGARRVVSLLASRAVRAGRGVEWKEQGNDVIAGSAGIGLFLLWHAARDAETAPAARALAVAAGERLLELGISANGGTKWRMDADFPRLMPNFSHGTAGIAYFLATLAKETGRADFRDAAVAGGRYLAAVANTEGGRFLVFHDEPDGTDLYYWSWCHGPPGTARLFRRLYELTGDCAWFSLMAREAGTLLMSGIPESEPPGFWNNVGPCCGLAGIADLFGAFAAESGERAPRLFADRLTAAIAARAVCDESGARWPHAENRVSPEVVVPQTGWMQGAAGIGAWLLRHDALTRGISLPEPLPDSPFP